MASDLMDVCHEEVSRQGMAEPCDRPAVAMASDPEGAYPVCQRHIRGRGVPLAEYRSRVEAEVRKQIAAQFVAISDLDWALAGTAMRGWAISIAQGGEDRG